MSREEKALDGVRKAIPDDEILDVGLTYPRGSTLAEGEGMAIGGLVGSLGGNTGFVGVGEAAGGIAGDALFSASGIAAPSIVIAVSPTAVYTLGRYTTSPFGSWDDLVPLVRFNRSTLRVEHHRSGALTEIHLTDTEHGKTMVLEAKPVGNLDIKHVLALLDDDTEG